MHARPDTKTMTIPGVAFACLVVAAALHHQFAVEAAPPKNADPRRAYYMTRTTHTGSQALTACAAGYHMASVFEISVPAMLRYERTLGVTNVDSGAGPPSGSTSGRAWVRSGLFEYGPNHCGGWTSEEGGGLVASFDQEPGPRTPRLFVGGQWCTSLAAVWCVQD
ncbi:hypothetical protein TBR22_A09870 [Luteitalea sp. TBR-22]|uniref:hypothetical protein n=1 Tax=Luteitalea sp. TBR-22 TaxID=2802971 RepID=UPI001AF19D0C|nr:hypothetical protein [Luteitalea sp. TBR-22]BCS31783.1 hypothetical protein TBR22_A09870 [Luteitalea sp. TBR-22]